MGFTEILFVAIIAIIFLGPEKLPEAMIQIAKFINSFRRTVTDAKTSFENEINISELKKQANTYRDSISNVSDDISGFKNSMSNPIDDLNEALSSLNDDVSIDTPEVSNEFKSKKPKKDKTKKPKNQKDKTEENA